VKVRALTAAGDYQVNVPFLVNSPQAVAQLISQNLKLWQGEWFLDITAGTPWNQSILGKSKNPDAYIKQAILSVQGVTSLASYSSNYSGVTRALTVSGTVNTLYGQAPFTATINPVL
jgi:hypothetical protein